LQLLNHANMDGTTIFVAGSGYAARTPRAFRRDMAAAMTHSDGILEWTNRYLGKYRVPNRYWRKRRTDGRGRLLLSNWNPQYWYIVKNMFQKMKRADQYLGHAPSTAKVAVMFSHRTALS